MVLSGVLGKGHSHLMVTSASEGKMWGQEGSVASFSVPASGPELLPVISNQSTFGLTLFLFSYFKNAFCHWGPGTSSGCLYIESDKHFLKIIFLSKEMSKSK